MGEKMRICVLFCVLFSSVDSSFIIRNNENGGFERVVISIDERLASSKDVLTSSSLHTNATSTYHCHTILLNIKELIQRTSEFLFKSTNGQSYFGGVSILLPTNWANYNCTGSGVDNEINSSIFETSGIADFKITPDHPIYNDKPWTKQFGPCGSPAKLISIPLSFVGEAINDINLRARLVVREWIKYRYGVFDENGFPHDEKYPQEFIPPNSSISKTACNLNRSCGDGEKCGNFTANKLNENLVPQRSLMSLPLESEGYELCSEKTHERTVPTKHNFLCDGKSIWEVMRENDDFMSNSKTNKNSEDVISTPKLRNAPNVKFSYATVKTQRMVFLLDRSKMMSANNRWSNLRQSLYRLFHYLPSGVELGVLSYTNTTSISLPFSTTSTHNRDHLHGRVPLKPLKDSLSACTSCALRDALKLIKSGEVGPTTVVILSSSPGDILTNELNKMREILTRTPLKLIIISYSDDFNEVSLLPQGAKLYRVPETQFITNLEQNEILNNIFIQTLSDSLNTPLFKVHQSSQWPNKEWQSQGQFLMEESLGRNTWVTITTEEIGDVDGLQLISPSGKEFELPLHAEGLVFIKVPGIAESGVWKYIINFYKNQSPRPITVDVLTEARKEETVSLKFWSHISKLSWNSTEVEVVRLYAEVVQGDLPVLNANVTAFITVPGKSESEAKTLTVRLHDTGNSDPDITWGDGIYSSYFTQLGSSPGFFTVTISVDDNRGQAVVPTHTNITRGNLGQSACCGSTIPHISTTPTGSFTRKIIGPSFQITKVIPLDQDPYPPSRITDLKIERTLESASELKLSWTAPGGDFDKGRAARYEIRCYTTRDALTNFNFSSMGILVHNSLVPTPEEFGVRQSTTVRVPWANELFYYGILAIDNSSNRGLVSNLVSVFIKELPTSTLNIVDAWEDENLVHNLTSFRSGSGESTMFHAGATWFRGLSEIELYIIIGGTGTFLILISTFILIMVCVRRNRTKDSPSGPPPYQNIYIDKGQGLDGPDGLKCCWENDASSSSTQPSHSPSKTEEINNINNINNIRHNYFNDSSSYIPASALVPPSLHSSDSIYRQLYSTPPAHSHPLHINNSIVDDSSINSNNSYGNSRVSGGNFENSRVTGGNFVGNFENREDDEGGFRGVRVSSTPDSVHGGQSRNKIKEYDYEYDSTLGGEWDGNSYGNKRKTRHISFV